MMWRYFIHGWGGMKEAKDAREKDGIVDKFQTFFRYRFFFLPPWRTGNRQKQKSVVSITMEVDCTIKFMKFA